MDSHQVGRFTIRSLRAAVRGVAPARRERRTR
jgi:hypothetical protein